MRDLSEIVSRYYENKQVEKKLSDKIKADNEEIKKEMLSANIETENFGDYKVTCKTIVTEDFDQDKLLKKIKSIWAEQNGSMTCPWVKQVEIVDMEALTEAIYDEMLSGDDLKDCKVQKSQVRLTVSKPKRKES